MKSVICDLAPVYRRHLSVKTKRSNEWSTTDVENDDDLQRRPPFFPTFLRCNYTARAAKLFSRLAGVDVSRAEFSRKKRENPGVLMINYFPLSLSLTSFGKNRGCVQQCAREKSLTAALIASQKLCVHARTRSLHRTR